MTNAAEAARLDAVDPLASRRDLFEIPDGLIWRWVSGKLEARRNGKGSE